MEKYRIEITLTNGEKVRFESNKDLSEIHELITNSDKWIIYNMQYINTSNVGYIKIINIEEEKSQRKKQVEKDNQIINSMKW